MAKFKIVNSFPLTGRGLVIVGDILEGEIEVGNQITFRYGNDVLERQILGVEFVDKVSEKIAHIGLIIKYHSEGKREDYPTIKIERQIAKVEQYKR